MKKAIILGALAMTSHAGPVTRYAVCLTKAGDSHQEVLKCEKQLSENAKACKNHLRRCA